MLKTFLTTIGGVQAKSISGSGLIDAATAMLLSGQMDAKGLLAQPQINLCDTDVYIDQLDIRQLQLAKELFAPAWIRCCRNAAWNIRASVRSFFAAGSAAICDRQALRESGRSHRASPQNPWQSATPPVTARGRFSKAGKSGKSHCALPNKCVPLN